MPRQGKRVKLARNIYKDKNGISGFVTVRGHREELRFVPTATIQEIRRELNKRRDDLDETLPDAPVRGTVRSAIEKYTAKLGDSRADEDLKGRLAAWTEAIGDEPFNRLTRAKLSEVIQTWKADGKAASTVAKRISSLRQVWRSIAPDNAPPHAIERLSRPREPKGDQIRARPIELIEFVLKHVERHNQAADEDSKACARLRVLAWTGQPSGLVQQLKREHVRWHATPAELYVQPRRKGRGVDAAWIPIVPEAVDALKEFFRVDAGGTWNAGVLKRAWDRAVARAQAALRAAGREDDAAQLEGMRVYDLRHSALTALAAATGDLYAVSEYARHSDIRTTLRYMRGAASSKMRAAISQLAEVLERRPILSVSPQTSSAAPRKKAPARDIARKKATRRDRPEMAAAQPLTGKSRKSS